MIISRSRYETLVRAEAELRAAQQQVEFLTKHNGALAEQIEAERRRAESAVDDLLLSKGAPPITSPHKMSEPDPDIFGDDKEELERLYKRLALDPVQTLLTEGVGDAERA